MPYHLRLPFPRVALLLGLAAWTLGGAAADGQALCKPFRTMQAPKPTNVVQMVSAPSSSPLLRPLQPLMGDERVVFTACDGWTGQDKFKHATFSFTLTASFYVLARNATRMSRGRALLFSLGTMTAVGLTKEWLDWQNPDKRCFSAGDMLANGLGMAAAAGIVLAF